MNEREMITGIEVPISFKYNYTAPLERPTCRSSL